MKNRLKIVRNAKGFSKKQIAEFLNITEETYSFYENDSVFIDESVFEKLSHYYNVDIRFLKGCDYVLQIPIEYWHRSLKEDYFSSDFEQRAWIECLSGDLCYLNENISIPLMSKQLLEIFEQLTDERKIALFNNAKGLLKEMKELGE